MDSSNGQTTGRRRKADSVQVLRQRRLLLLSSMALCAIGVLQQARNLSVLEDFRNGSNTNRRTLRKANNPPGSNTITLAGNAVAAALKDEPEIHLKGEFFVPSLDYRIGGRSEYHPTLEDLRKAQNMCHHPVRDLEWEFFDPKPSRHSKSSLRQHGGERTERHTTVSSNKRLLIGLYAGYDKYAELLETSAHIAKVYATLHGTEVSVVVLQGTAFAPQGCTPPGIHTTLNKVRLLFHAIDNSDSFDQALLLDADVILTNLETDVTQLLPNPEDLLAAHPVKSHHLEGDTTNEHRIQAGVTLWNLHHPSVKDVAIDWFHAAKEAVLDQNYRGERKFLQHALEKNNAQVKLLLDDEFHHSRGTVLRHFWQDSSLSWDERKGKLEAAALVTCKLYEKECQDVPKKQYDTE